MKIVFNGFVFATFALLVSVCHSHRRSSSSSSSSSSSEEVDGTPPRKLPSSADRIGPGEWSHCIGANGCNAGVRWRKYFGLYGKETVQFGSCEERCPVDGGYTDWTPWSHCSNARGNGKRSRWRFCIDPSPAFGGEDCSGGPVEKETEDCVGPDGRLTNEGYDTEWTLIGPCSATCGNGTQVRERLCNDTRLDACPNGYIDREVVPCNVQPCLDGGYTAWVIKVPCNDTMVQNGLKERYCIDPVPFGGLLCPAGLIEQEDVCDLMGL